MEKEYISKEGFNNGWPIYLFSFYKWTERERCKKTFGWLYIYILYIINESSLKKLQNATAFVITKPSNFNMSCNIFFHLVALNILKEFPQVPICIWAHVSDHWKICNISFLARCFYFHYTDVISQKFQSPHCFCNIGSSQLWLPSHLQTDNFQPEVLGLLYLPFIQVRTEGTVSVKFWVRMMLIFMF